MLRIMGAEVFRYRGITDEAWVKNSMMMGHLLSRLSWFDPFLPFMQ